MTQARPGRPPALFSVLALLVTGAILTVASAWASAYWSPVPALAVSLPGPHWPAAPPPGWPERPTDLVTASALGVTWRGATTAHAWGLDQDAARRQWAMSAGLPFRALGCVRNMEPTTSAAQGFHWVESGPQTPGGWREGISVGRTGSRSRRVLPLQPVPAGFLADTVAWAAAVWALRSGARWLRGRWRRRRGTCAACGHTLLPGSACPECGAGPRESDSPSGTGPAPRLATPAPPAG